MATCRIRHQPWHVIYAWIQIFNPCILDGLSGIWTRYFGSWGSPFYQQMLQRGTSGRKIAIVGHLEARLFHTRTKVSSTEVFFKQKRVWGFGKISMKVCKIRKIDSEIKEKWDFWNEGLNAGVFKQGFLYLIICWGLNWSYGLYYGLIEIQISL